MACITTSPCSPSPVAGWSGRFSQRQSNRQGGYSENAVIRSQVQCGVRPGHVHRAGTLRRVWWVGSHPSRHRSNAPGASMGLRVSACRTSVTGWGASCVGRRFVLLAVYGLVHRTSRRVCWVGSYAIRRRSTAAGAFTTRLVNVKGDKTLIAGSL